MMYAKIDIPLGKQKEGILEFPMAHRLRQGELAAGRFSFSAICRSQPASQPLQGADRSRRHAHVMTFLRLSSCLWECADRDDHLAQ
jgi:hypothetical protein